MKRILTLLVIVLLFGSCMKQDNVQEPGDKWNGYFKYLKQGEMIHTLWAGQNIDVGIVTYGIDDNANFYVTYDCSASGWVMSETHMFAGDKIDMPLNKPGNPKIGKFPNSGCHSPKVGVFTFTVPLIDLPPAEDPGFVVAAHCVVHSPSGQVETAWAEGQYTFRDKGWGWYDVYYFNQPDNPYTILYGTEYSNDTLYLYLIDMTNATTTLIFSEYVGGTDGTYDGAAFDEESGMFFFTDYNTGELWVNSLDDDAESFLAGTIIGTPASGTFYDGSFYYVDEELNTINRVNFTPDWLVASVYVLSTMPSTVTVTDIAMSPSGTNLYIVGDVSSGGTELITWDVAADIYYTMSIDLNEGSQIAVGSDGLLYAVEELTDGSGTRAVIVDVNTGVLTPIKDGVIIIDDPFSDISGGRTM